MIAILIVYGINSTYNSPTRQGLEFMLFSVFMVLGAVYSWAYLPNVQRRMLPSAITSGSAVEELLAGGTDGMSSARPRLETKSLEDLGEGRERAKRDGEITTVKEKLRQLKHGRRRVMASSASPGLGFGVSGHDIGLR